MKRVIFLIILTLSLSLQSCSKEKFENTGSYATKFISNIKYNGEIKEVITNINVELRNETKSSIQLNGVLMNKDGRKIEGTIPIGFLWETQEVQIELKRDFFRNEISGTFVTKTFYLGDWRETDGSVIMD